jgi:2-keto-4-pentenoate hydratase
MNTTKIQAAAELLLAARNGDVVLARLPDAHLPDDAAEAYAIQDAVALSLGAVGGWKVGAKGPGAPVTCAPMPAHCIFAAPWHFADSAATGMRGIEVEIALRMKQDLPPRPQAYTDEEVSAAVGTIHPSIELVSSRYAEYPVANPLAGLADALSNGAFIYGPGRSDLGKIDQRGQRAELHFDGVQVADAVGANPALDIWPLLTWLANHLAQRCGGLRAGQFVTTGSCTGLLRAPAGASIDARLENLGTVAISFAK